VVAFKIDTFGGMTPAIDDRLLPDRAAAHSENTWLYAGRLQGIPEPTLVRACTAGTARVFRIPNNYTDADHIDDSVWMEFENADTDVLRAMVIGDTFDRYYWASSSQAPHYNTRARIAAGDASWKLGIPQPAVPALVVVGGVATPVARAYLTTWVSAYGEEGPASTPVLVTDNPDGSWNLTLQAAAATDLGGTGDDRYLTHTRIYRTVTSATGVATYFLVAEIAIATLTYSDVLSDDVVASNSLLESTAWIGPPSDLVGFIAMPNGIVAGWRENELWFCEPYRPHAWPAAYSIVVDYPIVGLGVTNQTLVVCTQGYPVTVSGIHPASMAQSTSSSQEPCLSRGSILSTTEGVYYSSPNGLVFAGAGSISNITRNVITKDKWKQLTTAETLRAARLGTAYYAFGSSLPGVYDSLSFDPLSFAQDDFAGAYSGVLVDPNDPRVALSLMSDRVPISNIQNDPWSGELFIIQDDNLYRLDLGATSPVRRVYVWRSKVFQAAKATNLGAMKLYWETPGTAPAAWAVDPPEVTSGAEFPELPDGAPLGVVRIYADGVLRYEGELVTSGELHRPPSGFKASFWQIEIETYLTIYSVQLGTSVKALKGA